MTTARMATAPRVRAPLLIVGALAMLLGAVAAVAPVAAPALALVLLVGATVWVYPPVAAYLLLAVTPLIVGIDRGTAVPLLRPNEAMVVVFGAIVLLRFVWDVIWGRPCRVSLCGLDVALAVLAFIGSVPPLLWLFVREGSVPLDDLLFASTMPKYLMVYALFRVTIRTEPQVRVCLRLAVAAGVAVAVVGILQVLRTPGVADFLAEYYAPLDRELAVRNDRATSTIASSLAVADVLIVTLAIVMAQLSHARSRRWSLVVLTVLLIAGVIAAGQFSGFIGLVVAVVVLGVLTRRLPLAVFATTPVIAGAALVLRPVVQRRLSGFSGGLPPSWQGRLDNLRTFFWPDLFDDFDFVLGIRPSARVAAPERWREWVWIESGHTWLLWTGGLPYLLGFLIFLWIAIRKTVHISLARTDGIGTAAIASATGLIVIGVLTVLDPHLTLRGTADLLFPVLALSMVTGIRFQTGSELTSG